MHITPADRDHWCNVVRRKINAITVPQFITRRNARLRTLCDTAVLSGLNRRVCAVTRFVGDDSPRTAGLVGTLGLSPTYEQAAAIAVP
ncbi:hypothetical protein [Mycobacterium leprae]|uniref:hypothetical protein n=1 Tax=Mycobacterium leprae TaxID=1769 RepID=UPI000B071E2A